MVKLQERYLTIIEQFCEGGGTVDPASLAKADRCWQGRGGGLKSGGGGGKL